MATWDTAKHDIGYTQISASVIGLMLARDRNGIPLYRIEDDPAWPRSTASDLAAFIYPPARMLTCVVRCSDSITLKAGQGVETNSATAIKAAMAELAARLTSYIIKDIAGSNLTCRTLAVDEVVSRDEKDRAAERHYQLTLYVVSANT